MASSADHDQEYPDDFVAGLEWVWGEGFLSPGGRLQSHSWEGFDSWTT